MSAVLVIAGITLLLSGGTALVRGASSLATHAGISPLVIGLTVVAFGTSAPELVVNVLGAVQGETELAFGNVLGSNIANIGLVLGVAALVAPVAIQGSLVLREIPLLVLTTAMLTVMCLDGVLRGEPAVLDRADALLLFLMLSVFVYMMVRDLMREREDPLVTEVEKLNINETLGIDKRDLAWTFAGFVGLAAGGQLTIIGGVMLAEDLNLSKIVVGMAVVAVGTSLPELVTSIIAARRNEADLCVGNIIGSNLFNCLFVLPSAAVVTPIAIPEHGLMDVVVSLLFLLALIPIFIIGNAKMRRPSGIILTTAYFGYMAYSISVSTPPVG